VPEFDKGIGDLKPNEISEPFKSRYGWHIVQMLGTRTYDSTDDVSARRPLQRFARARRMKRPSFGCAGCAMTLSSKPRCRRRANGRRANGRRANGARKRTNVSGARY